MLAYTESLPGSPAGTPGTFVPRFALASWLLAFGNAGLVM